MDCGKVGKLISARRLERGMTQKQLADRLGISDRAVSKWERGLGCPDVSLLVELSAALGIGVEELLTGVTEAKRFAGGSMKKTKYYVCPACGSVVMSTGGAEVSCCGEKLTAAEPKKAPAGERLTVEEVEDEWFVSSDHPMTREHYISFAALCTGDTVHFTRMYPEWDMQTRMPRAHGRLIWYCTRHGLYYQNV